MSKAKQFSRRNIMKFGALSTTLPLLNISNINAQNLGPGNAYVGDIGGRDAERLFTGDHIEGGGQMEIRLNQSVNTSDPHELEVARRIRPFDPLSWYQEWTRVGEINEGIATGYDEQNLNVSAHHFYLRAFRFYRAAIVYQEDTDATMLPGI